MTPDLARYRTRGAVIDANLLLLLLVGTVRRELVGAFKRTRQYTAEDWDVLEGVLGQLGTLVTTPNVLTEVSNLGDWLEGPDRERFVQAFRLFVGQVRESRRESRRLVGHDAFPALGLTDVSLAQAARKGHRLLVTDDFALHQRCERDGIASLNFSHLRRWWA